MFRQCSEYKIKSLIWMLNKHYTSRFAIQILHIWNISAFVFQIMEKYYATIVLHLCGKIIKEEKFYLHICTLTQQTASQWLEHPLRFWKTFCFYNCFNIFAQYLQKKKLSNIILYLYTVVSLVLCSNRFCVLIIKMSTKCNSQL